jgi:hypothetical protein
MGLGYIDKYRVVLYYGKEKIKMIRKNTLTMLTDGRKACRVGNAEEIRTESSANKG